MILYSGFIWLMIRYRSGFCEHGKEASCSTTWRRIVQIFKIDTHGQDIPYFNQLNALTKIQ